MSGTETGWDLGSGSFCCSASIWTNISSQQQNTEKLEGTKPGGSDGKESACDAGDPGSIPVSGRSPRDGNGYLLHNSCLENSMDKGTWQAIVHEVAKSWTNTLPIS